MNVLVLIVRSAQDVRMSDPGYLFTRAFVLLMASDMAYSLTAGALLGITPFFVTGPLGAGPGAVGVVVGAFSVTTLIIRPWAGRWSDQIGRRPLLVGGAALFAMLILLHLAVTELWMLVLLRMLLGIAEGGYFVAGFAALADLAPPARAGEALSYGSVALYLGIAFGPAGGQYLLDVGGFGAVWIAAAISAGLAALLAVGVGETRPTFVPTDERPPLIYRPAVRPGLALFCGVAAAAGFLAFAGLHANALGLSQWSSVALVYGVVVVGCRIALAKLIDRWPPLIVAGSALALCAVGLIVVAATPAIAGVMAGAVLLAIGVALLTPAIFAAIFARVEPARRGAAAATASVFIDLALSLGPMVMGVVVRQFGFPAGFTAAGIIAVAGAMIVLLPQAPARVAE
jgi:MFS family permease